MNRIDLLQSIEDNAINEIAQDSPVEEIVQEQSLKFPEEWIRILYKKSLRDYVLDYVFFILKVLFIVLLPVIIVGLSMFSDTTRNIYNQQTQNINDISKQLSTMFKL